MSQIGNQRCNQVVYEIMSWDKFDEGCRTIAERVKVGGIEYDCIYGIPRGGMVVAVRLSHLLDVRVITDEDDIRYSRTLVVDDIADTGNTLECFRYWDIATLYYHKQSTVVPNIWVYEKTDKWVVFPWEVI